MVPSVASAGDTRSWPGTLGVRLLRVPVYIVPAPVAVANRLVADPMFFAREGLVTLGEALGGLRSAGCWRWGLAC